KLDPLARQVLVLALGRDAKVGSTKEHGRCLAGCVARDWDRTELRKQRRVPGHGVGDYSDLPAVRDDHRDVTLREGLVLLGLVAGLVRASELAAQALQDHEALLRLGAVARAGPRASRLR